MLEEELQMGEESMVLAETGVIEAKGHAETVQAHTSYCAILLCHIAQCAQRV